MRTDTPERYTGNVEFKPPQSAACHVTDVRLPPALGVLGNVAYVILVGAPYLLVPADRAGSLRAYYGFGPIDPSVLALFALVGAIALSGGRTERTDHPTAAGAALVAALAVLVFTVLWAIAVDVSSLPVVPGDWIAWHRWAVLLLAVVTTGTGVWYTRALEVF
ncbi:MAG: cytochrome bd-type quinol oxidase subunit 2 [Halobacteriales archaeon]|jgi:cytochrome bd-type quinol oxidase subunit 2